MPGNPYRLDVLIRVPNLKKLDGVPEDAEEREAARAKAAGQTPHFQSLVAARDAAGLEQAITQPAVEEQVIARARTAARELCNPALATDFPDLIAGIYRDWIIPLARRVQVETLLAGK